MGRGPEVPFLGLGRPADYETSPADFGPQAAFFGGPILALPTESGAHERTVGMINANDPGVRGPVTSADPGRRETPHLLPFPMFSGESIDFDSFKWSFFRYVQFTEQARGKLFSEEEKMIMLERALPERERKRFIHMQRVGKVSSAQAYLRDMEHMLSTANESKTYKQWNELSIRFGGRITPQDLLDFEMDFDSLKFALPHLSEGECHRHLMAKLPPALSGWVHEEEARLHLNHPQVWVNVHRDTNMILLKDALSRHFGVTIAKVCPVQGKIGEYILTLSDRVEARKATSFDGSLIQGIPKRLEVRDHRREFTTPEVFEFLHHKLQHRERVDQFHQSLGVERSRSPVRDSRRVRVAESGGVKPSGQDPGVRSFSPNSVGTRTPNTQASTPTSSRNNTPQRGKKGGKGNDKKGAQHTQQASVAPQGGQQRPQPPQHRQQSPGGGGRGPPSPNAWGPGRFHSPNRGNYPYFSPNSGRPMQSPPQQPIFEDGWVCFGGQWFPMPQQQKPWYDRSKGKSKGKGKGKGDAKGRGNNQSAPRNENSPPAPYPVQNFAPPPGVAPATQV